MKKIIYKGQELLPVTSDVVFKAIFGNEENKDLLLSLLNSFIDINIETPNQIEFVNTELIKHYSDDKLCRLDIRIRTKNREHIDVEIQVIDKKDMINRSVFYAASLYTEQMKEGMRYKELGRAIALNILCFNLFEDKKAYISSYRFKNRENNEELTDIIEINFVELKKVKKLAINDEMRDLWAKFLSAESEEELEMLVGKDETLDKAVETLKYVSADDIIRFEYDQRRKARLDYASDMAGAREEGREEGREEEKITMAKEMLADSEPIKKIMRYTKLTLEKIEELQKQQTSTARKARGN